MTQTLSQLEHNGAFIERHIGPSPEQQAMMLDAIGAPSLEALIGAIVPEDIQLPSASGRRSRDGTAGAG